MTNREWYLNKLNAMTNEELADYIDCDIRPWCNGSCSGDVSCCECLEKWLSETHQNPMPELKDGMFVEIDGNELGVVVRGKVVLKNGLYGTVNAELKSRVSKVYNTICFNLCDKSTCIWSKE